VTVVTRHLFTCDGCGAEALIAADIDLPKGWSRLLLQGNRIKHYCWDCTLWVTAPEKNKKAAA